MPYPQCSVVAAALTAYTVTIVEAGIRALYPRTVFDWTKEAREQWLAVRREKEAEERLTQLNINNDSAERVDEL
jgi:hypothetical protein